jgi:hypothetical protein
VFGILLQVDTTNRWITENCAGTEFRISRSRIRGCTRSGGPACSSIASAETCNGHLVFLANWIAICAYCKIYRHNRAIAFNRKSRGTIKAQCSLFARNGSEANGPACDVGVRAGGVCQRQDGLYRIPVKNWPRGSRTRRACLATGELSYLDL